MRDGSVGVASHLSVVREPRVCPFNRPAQAHGVLVPQPEASVAIEAALDKAGLKAEKHVAKELDVSSKDIDKAVQETAQELA